MKTLAALWRAVRAVLLVLAAIVLFIEEWGWRPLSAWAARSARWAPVARLEARIMRAPPRVALMLFLVPAILLVPVKLVALWLIDQGRVTLGVVVIVAAKVLGTALVGRRFVLVEPQLMQFAWFARILGWWRTTRERVMIRVHGTTLWRTGRIWRRAWRMWLRRVMH